MTYFNQNSLQPHQTILRNTLLTRQTKNASYSLRSFSKSLGISPSLLSQLISGQRPLTRMSAERILVSLDLSSCERADLLSGLKERTRHKIDENFQKNQKLLTDDQFSAISDWYHYGILGLSQISDNRSSPAWIANKLGLSLKTAEDAYTRLLRLGLIRKEGVGFRQATAPLETASGVPSIAIRKYHRQNLEKAMTSLTCDSVSERFFCALTATIDPNELPALTSCINKFKKKFAKKSQHRKRSRVYQLCIQFFPLDQEVQS